MSQLPFKHISNELPGGYSKQDSKLAGSHPGRGDVGLSADIGISLSDGLLTGELVKADSLSGDLARPQQEDLCRLITGLTSKQICTLYDRVGQDSHTIDLFSTTLPEAIHRAQEQGNGLDEAMEPLVSTVLLGLIREDPIKFGQLIAPALGPAIRQTVTQSVRNLMSSLEKTIEYSLSPKSLVWRWEAFRTGKKFAEVLLLKTLQYRVEHVFLIHAKSSLALKHLSSPDVIERDPDLISGLLASINNFAEDAFKVDESEHLDSFTVGSLTVQLYMSANTLLAVVVRGNPPADLQLLAQKTVENIQLKYGDELLKFNGEQIVSEHESSFNGIDDLLSPLISMAKQISDSSTTIAPSVDSLPAEFSPAISSQTGTGITGFKKLWLQRLKNRRVWMALGCLGLIFFIGSTIRSRSYAYKISRIIQTLRDEPGIQVTGTRYLDGITTVYGLQDASANFPEIDSGSRSSLRFKLDPYISLTPEMVLRRALPLLKPPLSLKLQLDRGKLVLSGRATSRWYTDAEKIVNDGKIVGVTDIDTSEFRVTQTEYATK